MAALDENLVTDLVPSEMACYRHAMSAKRSTDLRHVERTLDSSPGRMRRTEVWISRDEMVLFFEYDASSGRRVIR